MALTGVSKWCLSYATLNQSDRRAVFIDVFDSDLKYFIFSIIIFNNFILNMFNFFNKLFENYLKSFAPDMLRNLSFDRRYP